MKKGLKMLSNISAWTASFAFSFFALVTEAHAASVGLQNPLKSPFDSIPGFISGVLKVVVMIALPIITLLFVVVGYQFISAQGNSSKLEEAKKNFWYAVLGAFLILGAWILATLIAGTVSQLVS